MAPLGRRKEEVNPVFLARSRLRRRRFEDVNDICTKVLADNPYDEAVWYLQCRATTLQNALDDSEVEEEAITDLLLDDNATASVTRPGTSLARPGTSNSIMRSSSSGPDQGIRPVTSSGRPLTGFTLRPATGLRPGTGSYALSLSQALRGSTPGPSRVMTAMGREVRLGTASLSTSTEYRFIDVQKLNIQKFAKKPALAMALLDYLIYNEGDVKRAVDLCAEATAQADFKEWYWKTMLGKCYYRLGLYRDAEKELRSSLLHQPMLTTYLELVKVYLKLDLPNSAMDVLNQAMRSSFEDDTRCLLGLARVNGLLNDSDASIKFYKKVLSLDPSNVEAIACLAAQYFYTDQPELGLRFYRRLLQMGVTVSELWNNLGLSCFYASQYDMALSCLDRALAMSGYDSMADIWYNIGQVAIAMGDVGFAYQAFKLAISADNNHAESYCNLGVLERRKQRYDAARTHFATAQTFGPHLFEPFFNGALLAYKLGEFQQAFLLALKAEQIYPQHVETKELLENLREYLSM